MIKRHEFPPLHIAFITDKFGLQDGSVKADGVELMRELAKRHDITVIGSAYDSACELSLDFIPIHLSARWPNWIRNYLFAKQVDQIIKAGNYDLVHSHLNSWNGDLDVFHVESVRYNWLIKTDSWWKRLSSLFNPRMHMLLWLEKKRVHLKPPRRTAVVSESIKQQLQYAYKTTYPFDVITPGVHLPASNPTLRFKTRQELGFHESDTVALLIARNTLNKELDTILTALSTLPKSFKLLIVGTPKSLGKPLHSQLNSKQHSDKVVFIDQSTDLSSYYQAADMALCSTSNDHLGRAALEAMAYGLPVIMGVAKQCDFAQYVTHKKNAYLLKDTQNAAELQTAIDEIMSHAEQTQVLKQQGYELAKEFSWENKAKQVESIYVDIIATRLHRSKK